MRPSKKKNAKAPLWNLHRVMLLVVAAASTGGTCKNPGDASTSSSGANAECASTGEPFPWEGVVALDTGVDDTEAYFIGTGAVQVVLSGSAGLVWHSFQALKGGYYDGLYGRGVTLDADVRLVVRSDGTMLLTDSGGTEKKYAKSTDGVWLPGNNDGSRPRIQDDGTVVIELATGVYEAFSDSGQSDSNGDTIQVMSGICSDPQCKDPHTSVARVDGDVDLRVQSVTDDTKRTTLYAYSSETNLLESMTDPMGNQTTFGYDSLGNLNQITSPKDLQNRTFTVSPGYVGAMLATLQGPGTGAPTAKFDIDGSTGKLNRFESVNHGWTSFGYQADAPLPGWTTVTLNNRYNKPTVMVDDKCTMKSFKDALGKVASFLYDAAHQTVNVTDPDSKTAQLAFNVTGRDSYGNPQGIVGEDGTTTTFDYSGTDSSGKTDAQKSRITTATTPGGVTTVGYVDQLGTPVPYWVSPNDVATVTYKGAGGFTRTVTVTYAWADPMNPAGDRLVTTKDSLRGTRIARISNDGERPISMIDEDGEEVDYDGSFDPTNSWFKVTYAGASMRWQFDKNGNVTEQTGPGPMDDVKVTQDPVNGPVQVSDSSGVTKKETFDDNGVDEETEDDDMGMQEDTDEEPHNTALQTKKSVVNGVDYADYSYWYE